MVLVMTTFEAELMVEIMITMDTGLMAELLRTDSFSLVRVLPLMY